MYRAILAVSSGETRKKKILVRLPQSFSHFVLSTFHFGRCRGLMVSALDSGASGPGSSLGRGHGVVVLGKTLYSYSASPHPGISMGTGKLLG